MIDREKVIRALENCTDEIKCRDCPWETCETFCLSVSVPLDLAKAALSLLKAQEPGWISVKDRLPEKTERYMCLCYDFVTKSYWHELLWLENNHWWKSLATLEYDYKKHVAYWMPLPEPPKEG